MEISVASLSQLPGAAQELIQFAERQKKKVLFFYGNLGAGKTTLIRHLCAALGVEDTVSSPTFSLVNEYRFTDESGEEQLIFHMDLYRLKNLAEALNIGIEEYLSSGAWCLIEWPELIEDFWPEEETLKVQISEAADSARKIVLL